MCAPFVLSLSKHEREIPRDRSPFDKLRVNGLVAVMVLFSLAGCSDMHTPTVKEALTRPLGTAPPFTLGTRKAKVLEAWGNPDYVVAHGSDELGNVREEWIYHGRMQSLPIDYEYLSRDKHLFFEGENLTRCTTDEKDSR